METTNFDSLFTDDALSSAIGDDIFGTGSAEDYEQKLRQKLSQIKNIDRAAELKKKELFRKGKLEYEDNGELIHDSNAMIRAKEIGNAGIRGVDWLLEASENIADFGQGDLIDHYDGFMAENHGKRYSMDNKDFIAARDLGSDATEQLASQYKNAIHDPNADKGIYTLRKFDGYNPDGSTKYIYKYGLAEVGADARYRDQNVQDGFEIVEEKRFAGAEDWEKTWNASQGVLNNRVLDNSIDLVKDFDGNMVTRDEASGINFGSGKTELLNSDLLGTDIGKTQEDYDRNQEYSERLTKANDAIWQNGMYSNPYRAIKSGAASLLVDTADFIFDVLTPGDNTWLNDVKKKENIDKWVGYDRTQSTQALSDAATFWKQGNYFDAITTVVSDPNTMAESIPMMLGMMVPIPGTRAAKVMQITERLNKAKKLKTSLSDIALARHELKAITSASEYKKITELNQMPAKIKAYDHFARNAGFHTIVGELTNNVLDDRIAEKIANGEPGSVSMGEVLSVYALQLPLLAIDRMSFKAILGLGKEGKVLKDAFSSLNSQGKASVVTAITKKAGEMTAAGAGEGVQEYVQTWGEILGAKALVGDNSISDVFSDEQNQKEALMGGLGGLGAGGQMSALANVAPLGLKAAG
ncbi:MAG: hypothetical protein KAH01_07215, partial [Caldisericia bacterium]|nr:hypothetical protein [Caldisericia bacterium]